MNITVFDNLLGFPRRTKVVSLETKNFLHFLLEDEYFQNELKTLRKKYGIPANGYPLDKLYSSLEIQDELIEGLSIEHLEEFHRLLDQVIYAEDVIFAPDDEVGKEVEKRKGKLDAFIRSLTKTQQGAIRSFFEKEESDKENKNGFSIRELEKKMEQDLERLTAHYELRSDFESQFFMIIAFNAFQNIEPTPPFLFMASKEDIVDEVQKSKESIGALLVYEKTTKNQLVKWIEGFWPIIEGEMEKLPAVTYQKSTLLDISKEIADLREHKKMLFREIANHLTDKYPHDKRVTDETWVKETYKRYKDRLKAFTKRT